MYNRVMDELKYIPINGELNAEDKKTMVDGMLAYHASKGHPRKTETYSVALKDSQGRLLGCVIVSFLWNGMHIDSLWVDESLRGNNYGTKLLEMAEKEGVKRGCTIAYTDTFTWQAPEFYKKLGYKEYGRLEDFPVGNTLTYFFKNL